MPYEILLVVCISFFRKKKNNDLLELQNDSKTSLVKWRGFLIFYVINLIKYDK